MSERDETREAVARAIVAARNLPEGCDINWSRFRQDADAVLKLFSPGSRFTVEGVECVVVPVEPRPKMRFAGTRVLHEQGNTSVLASDLWPVYRAMLRACEEKGDGR